MDIVLLSMFAAMGLAIKQMAYPLAAVAAAPLFLPVAPLASGAYMMWLTAGRASTGYRWAGTFMGAVQGIVALLLIFGRHGAFNLPLYASTGLVVDLVFLIMGRSARSLIGCALATSLAAMTGTVMVVYVELAMSWPIVAVSALLAAGSGILGGFGAHRVLAIFDSISGPGRRSGQVMGKSRGKVAR